MEDPRRVEHDVRDLPETQHGAAGDASPRREAWLAAPVVAILAVVCCAGPLFFRRFGDDERRGMAGGARIHPGRGCADRARTSTRLGDKDSDEPRMRRSRSDPGRCVRRYGPGCRRMA